jgi:Ca2+/Na+ antiporter
MTPQDKSSAVAAAILLAGFAVLFMFMPKIVLALGGISPWLGGLAALLFMLSFYIVFWLRGKYLTRKRGAEER